MPDTAKRDPNRREIGKMITDGLLAANGQVIRQAAKVMLIEAPRTARFLLKRIPGAPGFAMTVAETLHSKVPWRPVFGALGGALGGAAGAGLGMATGPAAPIAAPIGAAVGAVTGEHVAEEIYDDSHEAVRARIEEAKAWMRDRKRELDQKAQAAGRASATPYRPFL